MEIFIPLLPPGLNATYRISGSRLYKSEEATAWENDAALIIGSEAARQEWADNSEFYQIEIKFSNWRQDVDAPVKLILDCISQKLGFNDKRIMKQCSEKVNLKEPGVLITLEPYNL